ncbi:LPS assembly protein LptD [Massilia sp. CCM 8695]|uniref:LPS-assembly protein LptD n=1 Tax=Massilia frigida TaxID=2609281 RepID=A0ABX0NGV0_9BURK|nr:LPS-assembly protein LptD [Massilia frigida]NHZ82379.1 LPS assembly protein LptD [Massilia frigida]
MSWKKPAALPSQRWAYALTALVTATAVPLHAQTVQNVQKRERTEDPNLPVNVRAEEISGRPERELILERGVELSRGQTRMKADRACFKNVENEVTANGNVWMERFGDTYKGEELQLNLSSGKGWVLRPEYRMGLNNAQGAAKRVDFISEDEAIVVDGTYTTCEGLTPDWYLKSNTLRLDAGRDVGVAGKTVIYFKGVPIIGTPALSFSLSGARRSGWLPPTVGLRSKGRAEVLQPYYVNIAPNRDLTLYPRWMLDRGIQFGATARYLGENAYGGYSGQTHAEVLPNDKVTKTDRWRVNSLHNQGIARGLSFGWNLNGASDDNYPSDFSQSISSSAERQLVREVRTDYRAEHWNMSLRAQSYQILQDPNFFIARPYARLPELLLHAGRYDVKGFDWAVDTEVTRFAHPDLPTGNRAVVMPQLSYPIVRPGYHITPKLSLHASAYELSHGVDSAANAPTSLTRVLPTFSLDSGLVFERDAKLAGRQMTQTLEPRLFYVYTPYKDQSKFPNFDTFEASFNMAQIFNENRFIGNDRVSDANQLTAALVSRFLESNGAERLRLVFGQRFYLNEQRVQLLANAPRTESRSDVLLQASGRISEKWNFDSAVQYNASASSVVASNYGVQWQPGEKKVINAEYRFLRDSVKNAMISSQWPLSKRWYGVGRMNYSVLSHKVVESLVGLEYQADCWVFRMGGQRFVTTTRNTSTQAFVQLELNGLSKLGFGSPLESFYKSVPGYTRLNPGPSR